MKILLRHSESRLYYATSDRWVAHPGMARDFGDVDLAAAVARREGLPDMEVVLSFNHPPGELLLPLAAKPARRQAQGQDTLPESLLPGALQAAKRRVRHTASPP